MSIAIFLLTFVVGIVISANGQVILAPLSLYESMSVMANLYTASIAATCTYLILKKKK